MRGAAGFAQLSWVKFEQILAERDIPLQYSKGDLDKDLKTWKS